MPMNPPLLSSVDIELIGVDSERRQTYLEFVFFQHFPFLLSVSNLNIHV